MYKYLTALLSISLGAVAQLLLKVGSDTFNKLSLSSFFSIFTNKYLMLGLLSYGLSAILWINFLSKEKLSVAYPLVSLGYIFTMFLAYFFLHEEIHLNNIIGLAIIIVGIIVITR
jgi:drug/metabolite transporter (DMT)-like permease